MATGPPFDEVFGVFESRHVFLRRKVEVYCWTEYVHNRPECYCGDACRKASDFEYELRWCEWNQVKSSSFKDQKY